MERLLKRNDFIAARSLHLLVITARQLDRGFIRFRPAVAKEHLIRTAVARKQRSHPVLPRNVEQIRYMPQCINLCFQLRPNLLGSVAQTRHCESAHEVEVLVALIIPNPAAFALDQTKIISGVGREYRTQLGRSSLLNPRLH
ncbi:hypothetical protein D3C81_1606250 [compost metagenome]